MLQKKYTNNIQQITEMIFIYSNLLLFFSLPFHRVASSIPLILLCLSSIAYFYFNKYSFKKNNTFNLLLYFNLGFFIINLLHYALFFKSSSFNSLQILSLIIIVPLVLYQSKKSVLEKSLNLYIAACVIFTFIISLNALSNFKELGVDTFFYTNLLVKFKQNPIILSFYYNISILCLTYKLPKTKSAKNLLIYFVLFTILASSVILFGSKIGYIMLLAVSIISFLLLPINKFNKLIITIITSLILIIIALKVPYVNHEIKGTIWQITKDKHIVIENKLPRPIVWKASKNIIEKNFYTGVGSGNSVEALQVEFEKIDYQKGIVGKFNTHNQFIETLLENGVFVFTFLIILFLFYFYVAIQSKSIYFLSFLILTLAYMLVESIFKSQTSFVAFVLFCTTFYKLDVLKNKSNA